MATNSQSHVFEYLDPFDPQSKNLHAIIETPKGSRNKYKYNEKYGIFTLHKVLPLGTVFPFDFGYIPSTLGGDGDPLDVLVLVDQETFTGCLIPSRLIGVIEAEQTQNDKTVRNSRFVAVAAASHDHSNIHSIDQLDETMMKQIEHFFIYYDSMEGKEFKPIRQSEVSRAMQLIQEGRVRFQQQHPSK